MNKYVLLVEDDEDIRENLSLLLEFKGHRVETARHGEEALQRIEVLGAPCLVILDLMMPVMDGWQFHEALRADPAMTDVPVVLLSGVTDVDHAAQAMEAVDHLKKPCGPEELYRIVKCYC